MAPPDNKSIRVEYLCSDRICRSVSGCGPNPKGRGTTVNVASCQHGAGYDAWTRVHGFSEAVIAWIAASEETKH